MFRKINKSAGEVLEFPSDVLGEGPKITIIGRTEAIIEYYQEVIQFSNEEIVLKTSEGRLLLQGQDFVLTTVLPKELHIKGSLSFLQFLEEGRKNV